jgi:hypothetical protein
VLVLLLLDVRVGTKLEKKIRGAEQKFYIDLALLLPLVNIH